MQAWNDWYHSIYDTCGVWLPGNPRGRRTRHHRQHVEIDCKTPPAPGTYEDTLQCNRKLMKHPRA